MTETQIRPLTQEYVRETLKGFGLTVLTDPDGDSLVILGDERLQAHALMIFAVDRGKVLSYLGQVENVFLDENTALLKANQWNDERRWPRAFVRKGKLHLDYHWDLEQGIHPGLLRDLLLGVIMGTGKFLLWLEGMEA
ncbi:YbjN domain-containing protein [Thermus sp.]|uniref:YbjN domain-containing protein n=1 Tax=Thermus sp. TaxID=275 RepID=UPI003D130617